MKFHQPILTPTHEAQEARTSFFQRRTCLRSKRRIRLLSLCRIAGAAAALGAAPRLATAAPFMTAPCADSAGFRQLCGFADPEDLAALFGTPWVLVSQMNPQNDASGFAFMNTADLHVTDIKIGDIDMSAATHSTDCTAQPQHYKPGGIGIRREGEVFRIVAIRHEDSGRDAVEFFDAALTAGVPRLRWIGCVLAPEPLFLNDIAALPGRGFAATHMFDRALAAKDPKAQKQRYRASENTGYVVTWSPDAGWRKVPNSDGSFPNGIDSSPDGKLLYMAETYGHRINAMAVDGSGRRSIHLAMQPDNVTVTAGGSVIVAGGTGVPLVSTDGCAKFRPQGCGFPSEVDEVDFGNSTARKLFSDTGDRVPGASVGLAVEHKLFVGTSFGNRITVVELPQAIR